MLTGSERETMAETVPKTMDLPRTRIQTKFLLLLVFRSLALEAHSDPFHRFAQPLGGALVLAHPDDAALPHADAPCGAGSTRNKARSNRYGIASIVYKL